MGKGIHMLVMDVDGTLTDGNIHISSAGECYKSFHVRDGFGIRNLLPQYGIIPVIVTGRISEIVEYRAKELMIQEVHQGVADKAACVKFLQDKYDCLPSRMACIGDDENDLPMLAACGVRGCPADAVQSVKQICDFVSKFPGGQGAVREFIDWLVDGSDKYYPIREEG